MKLNSPVSISLVSRDGTKQQPIGELTEWSLSALRSRISECLVTVSACPDLSPFLGWSDYIEFELGEDLMMRYLYRKHTPNGVTTDIEGIGVVGKLYRRHRLIGGTVSGYSPIVWARTWLEANATESINLEIQPITELGTTVEFEVEAGDALIDIAEKLAGVHVVYTEHAGTLHAAQVGSEATGPPIEIGWMSVANCLPPAVDYDSMVNEVAIRYGKDLTLPLVTYPPNGLPDPVAGSRLQSGPLDFPEITDRLGAEAMAKEAHSKLSVPQVVLGEQLLDPSKVDWDWLIPGRSQISHIAGAEGIVCNLDQVEITGRGPSILTVTALWDQADVGALRDRITSTA